MMAVAAIHPQVQTVELLLFLSLLVLRGAVLAGLTPLSRHVYEWERVRVFFIQSLSL